MPGIVNLGKRKNFFFIKIKFVLELSSNIQTFCLIAFRVDSYFSKTKEKSCDLNEAFEDFFLI